MLWSVIKEGREQTLPNNNTRHTATITRHEVQALFQEMTKVLNAIGDGHIQIVEDNAIGHTEDRRPTIRDIRAQAAINHQVLGDGAQGLSMPLSRPRQTRARHTPAGPRRVYRYLAPKKGQVHSTDGLTPAEISIANYISNHDYAVIKDICTGAKYQRSTVMAALRTLQDRKIVISVPALTVSIDGQPLR